LDFPLEDARPKLLPMAPSAPAIGLTTADAPRIPTRGCDVNEVLRCVCQAYLISVHELVGKDRHRNVAEARVVAYWLLRTIGGCSYPETGRALKKDHTSAMSGWRRCEARRDKEPAFLRFTDELAAAVRARLEAR
jgi:chromosomal replication initiation ATPase DnaA